MLKLLILGNGQPVQMIINSFLKEDIKVVNVEQDRTLPDTQQDEFAQYLSDKNIGLNTLNNLDDADYDIVLSMNYNRIIQVDKFSDKILVNLHMGLLPMYRGNNANAWAVINGEKEVGYTLHEISDVLDGGAIYYKYAYNIGSDQSYFNAKNAINQDIIDNLGKVLIAITEGSILAEDQKSAEFVYCAKLRSSDGVVKDWNVDTELLLKKGYVFGKPLGTGLKFSFKGKSYDIGRIEPIQGFAQSIGAPGSIVYMFDNKMWVKTRDTAVQISELECDSEAVVIAKDFKIGMRLNS
ncbi:formyltransferase family protein [Carboxylicivirga sp. N1Y90]|uniref:formyltransferase family protein n=1 Tax=Carboxylicivirga fragile TaxID=3417571 RepID=UPI003D35813B|nr:hypothetical protein [Marinilabiliaceae bacterium N1Y90]